VSGTEHYTGDEMKELRWVRHVVRMGERSNAYGVLVGKLTGKRQLGRTRRRRELILEWGLKK
jgi:hypothetical protein